MQKTSVYNVMLGAYPFFNKTGWGRGRDGRRGERVGKGRRLQIGFDTK